ncbi:transcriptional regulator, partial [Streptococcus agalactiae]|nr:transcriptional regulator [Streptococcus agalactiae]
NKIEPEKIGKYISALANSSTMLNKQFSYLVWGISDDKEIIGTNFYPYTEKINGGEPLISWLERNLEPRISIKFQEFEVDTLRVVVLINHMTVGRPVAFKGTRYIRSGSSLKNLAEFPEKERQLWKSFEARTFEKEFALTNCPVDDLIALLDFETYRKMLNYPPESNYDELLQYMLDDNIIEQSGSGFN